MLTVAASLLTTSARGTATLSLMQLPNALRPWKLVALVLVAGYGLAGCSSAATPKTGSWTCVYDPTMNRNWHDDVLCSNGSDTQRPSLRDGDDFITKSELMESAAEFEAELNSAN